MNRKLVVILLATLATIGGLLLYGLRETPTIGRKDTDIAVLLAQPGLDLAKLDVDLLSDVLSYRFAVGQAYSYAFRRSIRLTMQGKEVLDLELSGLLNAHAVRVTSERLDIVLDLDFQKVRGMEAPSATRATDDERDRTHSVHLAIDRHGRVLETKYPREVNGPDEAAVIADIVAKWLVSLPTEDQLRKSREHEAKSKTGVERAFERLAGQRDVGPLELEALDAQGEFAALFRASQSRDDIRVEARKLRYTRSPTLIRILRSETNHVWNQEGGFFQLVDGSEELGFGESSMGAESRQTFRFDFRGRNTARFGPADLSFFQKALALSEAGRSTHMRDLPGTPVRPWKELKKLLAALRAGASRQEKNELFNSLATSLKSNPTMAEQVVSEVRAYRPGSEQYEMLMGALTYSGAPAVQRGLVAHARSADASLQERLDAVQAFTMMSAAFTEEVNGYLLSSFDDPRSSDIRDNVGLALGSSLRNSRNEGDPSTAKTIRKRLEQEWRQATTTARRLRVLEMIGNSGDGAFLELLQEVHANGESPEVRNLALYSMRFIDNEQAGRHLVGVLSGSDGAGRSAAIEALSMHTFRPFYFDALSRIVRTDRETSLRIKAGDILLNQPDETVRRKALEIIESSRSSGDREFQKYADRVRPSSAK